MAINLQQRQLQKQVQILSQKQIQSLNMLSMSTQDLVAELRKLADENPMLVIDEGHKRRLPKDNIKVSSSSASGEQAS